jgi:hypothetical protein
MHNAPMPRQPAPGRHPYHGKPSRQMQRIRDMAPAAREPIVDTFDTVRIPNEVEPLRLHRDCADRLRQQLHARRMKIANPSLERFAKQVFGDDLMVEAYFHPRAVPADFLPARVRDQAMLPIEAALQAASRAYQMPVISAPHEREMAYLAALVYPCGLFHCRHPWVEKTTGIRDVEFNRAGGIRHHLLAWPMGNLRATDEALGDTLGQVLDQGVNDHFDPEQVARIGAAVWTATQRVTALWTL